MNRKSAAPVIFLGCTVILVCLSCVSVTLAAEVNQNVWGKWRKAWEQQCPSRHLDLLADSEQDELITDFENTLQQSINKKVDTIADIDKRCADVKIGFYCEMAVYLDAYVKLGLLHNFTAFGCHRYKCIEAAWCVDPTTNKHR